MFSGDGTTARGPAPGPPRLREDMLPIENEARARFR
jgi:hypothetical protein